MHPYDGHHLWWTHAYLGTMVPVSWKVLIEIRQLWKMGWNPDKEECIHHPIGCQQRLCCWLVSSVGRQVWRQGWLRSQWYGSKFKWITSVWTFQEINIIKTLDRCVQSIRLLSNLQHDLRQKDSWWNQCFQGHLYQQGFPGCLDRHCCRSVHCHSIRWSIR